MSLILRPYQVEAVDEVLRKKRVLIADDMGLGKCAEAISVKNVLDKRHGRDYKTIIICPNSVMQHWANEIAKWSRKGVESRVTQVHTISYDEDLKRGREAEYVILSYPTLSYFGNDQEKMTKLERMRFDYGIIDEAHNAKNPESIRGMASKRMLDEVEYLSILSGTPMPNTVVDIYVLLSMLDKEHFPLNTADPKVLVSTFYQLFRQDPTFVKRVLGDRMLRRTVEDYLQVSVPKAVPLDRKIILRGAHEEIYRQIYENSEIKPGTKLIQLLKAAIDPNLVDPRLVDPRLAEKIGDLESNVYDSLEELIEEAADKKGKVLIFSNLREGVTRILKERFRRFGSLVIDKDVPTQNSSGENEREELRRKFQRDPNYRVLIATTVMDEGVDLTAATDVVHLTLPYTPAAVDQRNRRSQRVGEVEKDEVKVHTIKPLLTGSIPTIVEGVEKLLADKRKILGFLMNSRAFEITKEDLEEIKNGHTERSRSISPFIKAPTIVIKDHLVNIKGMGADKIKEFYEKSPEQARYFATLYAQHWDGNYGGNTANLYSKVIRILEQRGSLERKLDICSGPFSMSRSIQQPVTNLDINPFMLQAGRILEEQGIVPKGNISVEGSMTALPFDQGSFDFTLCSLALHMTKAGEERIQAFKEINRVLENKGYGLITLPYSILIEEDLAKFYTGLTELGFKVFPFSGFYRGPQKSKFKVFMAGLQKQDLPQDTDPNNFVWHMDREMTRSRSGKARKGKKPLVKEAKEIKKEDVKEFFSVHSRKPIEESVESCLRD